jgi:polyisoprenoid-binding protein YceI
MKRILLSRVIFLLTINISICIAASSQTVFKSDVVDIRLAGTSTLHDWEMKSVKGISDAEFTITSGGKVSSLSKLSFSLPVKSLKSDHIAMDNNAYKAMKTGNNPNLNFILTSSTIKLIGENHYQINCIGKMTIAGTTKEINLVADARYNTADKTFTVSGIKKMKMTDYNVKPPKVVLGTIKTGNDISISYNMKYVK